MIITLTIAKALSTAMDTAMAIALTIRTTMDVTTTIKKISRLTTSMLATNLTHVRFCFHSAAQKKGNITKKRGKRSTN